MDFHAVCRLCCVKKAQMKPILDDHGKYPLIQMFSNVLRLKVYANDGLPQKICKMCISDLTKLHEAIECYRANDLMLRQQLLGVAHVEIKEEEVDMEVEMLEEAHTKKIAIGENQHEETEIKAESLEIEPDDNSDEEWQQSVQDSDEAKHRSKKTNGNERTRKARKGKLVSKGKPGRRKTVFEDPNRPRMNDYICYICKSDPLGSPEALLAHLNTHTNEVPYTCTICVLEIVEINSVTTLNVHKRMHENPYKCEYCDRRYSSKRNIALHVQMYHLGDNAPCPSTCEYCGKVCSSKQALKTHEKVHTKAVSCEFCGKVFVEKHKLRLHIQRIHEQLKKYECHFCHKKLKSLDSVQVHMKTMHSTNVYQCEYCSKSYTSEFSLKSHEKKHESDPTYKSTNNWKEYYDYVEGDEGIVDGVRLKKCKLCDTNFKAIAPHLNAVHFPKEFRCELCGLVFKRKNTYEIHVKEHEHGKAYRCPICGREFSERKYLLTHLKTKKHRDHPLAKSLDWLYESTGSTRLKEETKFDHNEESIEEDIRVV